MWLPTEEEAVEIFARHFEALHRSGSVPRARRTAESLKERGDNKGHQIWHRVAEKIEDLRKDHRVAQRRAMERS
jgi:tellurite resistance protein